VKSIEKKSMQKNRFAVILDANNHNDFINLVKKHVIAPSKSDYVSKTFPLLRVRKVFIMKNIGTLKINLLDEFSKSLKGSITVTFQGNYFV
jgi:hypothetical protein